MKLLLLDRDGVINRDSPEYVKSPGEWHALPGSLEAMARLSEAGWRLVIVTNQSGLGRGLFDLEDLGAMHTKMQEQLAELGGRVEAVFFCPHRPDEGCACRKPAPGLLLDIARRFDTSLEGVPFVGDSLKDMEAARAVGARPFLVRTGKGSETEKALQAENRSVETFDDLAAFAEALLAGKVDA
ncbi:MAG: D-glycero-beta-D-manno-heptose 1,7-bisphosphate 7-phosphatase [Gammaproteobacteria bacterium]